MPSDDAIYVEIPVEVPVADVWDATQEPDQHERWDLRFTRIDYLPKEPDEPQRFTYRTGFGPFEIAGEGESVADADPGDHEPTSALQFWSDDPKSLIEHGRGYWRYVPTADGHRFITEYNYDTRFGAPGRWVDRLLFRPLIGWATAFSFDTLRYWVEDGIRPEESLRNTAIHGLARATLAFVWCFLGLVPKLLVGHPTERALTAATVPAGLVDPAMTALGVAEVGFGFLLLLAWHRRWLLLVSAAAPPLLTVGALIAQPGLFLGPFSPAVLALLTSVLSVVAYVAGGDLPSARRCLRARPEDPQPATAAAGTDADAAEAEPAEAGAEVADG